MPVIDCKEFVNGIRCHADHSRFVCNSGVVYCMAARSSGDIKLLDIDDLQPTLQYMQDIPINQGAAGRIMWDNGSNCVLVNNAFAKERQLKSKNASVTLKVVGEVKRMQVKIYELYLEDKNG